MSNIGCIIIDGATYMQNNYIECIHYELKNSEERIKELEEAIKSITGEAAFGGLPEEKQEKLLSLVDENYEE